MSEFLTQEQISQLKAEIESKLLQAEQSVGGLVDQTAPVKPDVSLGRLTRMDAIQQKSMAESNLGETEKLIIGLKQTYQLLDSETIGRCESCWNAIGFERFMAVPHKRICLNCTPK